MATPPARGRHSAFAGTRRLVAKPRRQVKIATAALAVVGATLGVVIPLAGAGASDSAVKTGVLVNDQFNRTVSGSFGSASVGGSYATHGSPATFGVTPGHGFVQGLLPGRSAEQVLQHNIVMDSQSQVTLTFPTVPATGTYTNYSGIETRYQLGSSYEVLVQVNAGGTAVLDVSRRLPNGSTYGLIWSALPAIHANEPVLLEVQQLANGISARATVGSAATPAWTTAVDTNAQALNTPGYIGLYSYTSARSSATSAYFSDFEAWTIAAAPVTPPVTSSSPVASPSSSSSSPAPAPSVTSTSSSPSAKPSSSSSSPAPAPSVTSTSSAPTPPPTSGDSGAVGSATLGATNYAIPSGAVFVSPSGSDSAGDGTLAKPFATIANALHHVPSPGTIVLRAGSYHESDSISPSQSITIQSYPGEVVWLDGSVPVTGWNQSGSTWVHSGWTTQFDHSASFTKGSNNSGFLSSSYPLAAWPDEVFMDGSQLTQVAANPGPGQFAVDYSAQTLSVGSNPSGHSMAASTLQQAFVVSGQLNLLGIGVHRYATGIYDCGTLFYGGSVGGSRLENDVITDNATQGLYMGQTSMTVNHLSVVGNGMGGIEAAYASGGVVENSSMSGNNTEHFAAGPSNSGIKVLRLNGFVVRNNIVENNSTETGIWTDENVTNFQITGNTVAGNGPVYGILTELSDTGIVADNTVTGSKYGYTAYDTGDVKIFNNTFANNSTWDLGGVQDNRYQPGKGTAGPSVQPSAADPWLVRNLTVDNNLFETGSGLFQFYVEDQQTGIPASSMNLMIAGNSFLTKGSSIPAYAVGWGQANETVTPYATSAAFESAIGVSWPNMDVSSTAMAAQVRTQTSPSVAVALPSDVASAVGQPNGTKHIGAF